VRGFSLLGEWTPKVDEETAMKCKVLVERGTIAEIHDFHPSGVIIFFAPEDEKERAERTAINAVLVEPDCTITVCIDHILIEGE